MQITAVVVLVGLSIIPFQYPYITHYFDAPFSQKYYAFKDLSGAILDALINSIIESILDQMIRNQTTELPDKAPTTHSNYIVKEGFLRYRLYLLVNPFSILLIQLIISVIV